jgi:hypothetical protein
MGEHLHSKGGSPTLRGQPSAQPLVERPPLTPGRNLGFPQEEDFSQHLEYHSGSGSVSTHDWWQPTEEFLWEGPPPTPGREFDLLWEDSMHCETPRGGERQDYSALEGMEGSCDTPPCDAVTQNLQTLSLIPKCCVKVRPSKKRHNKLRRQRARQRRRQKSDKENILR